MEVRAVSLLTNGAQPPQSNCQIFDLPYSEFDRSRDLATFRDLPVLYPGRVRLTLAQKLFRREPAITKLDQLFTSYHKSSQRVERLTGSGLHLSFDKLHPAHGKLALASGLIYKTQSHYQYSVSLQLQPFKPQLRHIYQLVGSFFNRHAMTEH